MNLIRGEKIDLRPITEADTDNILRWRNSEHVRRNFLYQKTVTKEDHAKWLKDKVATGQVIQFIMIEKETGRPIGSVYLRDVDRRALTAEYGVFIGEADALGKGYGSEVIRMILKYAFETEGLKHLTLRVRSNNDSAKHVYEKAGFIPDTQKNENEVLFYQIDAPEA